MPLKKNKADRESKQFWEYVERTAAEVETWPDWKKGIVARPAAEPGSATEEQTASSPEGRPSQTDPEQ